MPQCSVKGMGSGREEIDKEEEEDEVPEEEEDEVADGHNQGFPKDEEIQKRWIHMCSRQDPINAKNALICSLHFKESDFERNLKYELLKKPVPKRLVQLKKGSVPTLHLPQTQVQPVSCSREVRAVRRGQKRLVEEILRRVLEETEEEIAKEKPANKGTHFLGKKELQRELENISKKREAEKTSRMAISSISVVKRRKRVKKSESLDSDEDQPESEEEKYVIENDVQDDDFDSFNLEGASFTPYPNDSYFVEIIEGDFDEVYIKEEKVEDWESEGSANEYKIKETKQKRTKKVKFSEPEASSNGLDDRHKNFLEGEKDEDSCGDDESEKEEGIYKQSVGSGLANVMAKIPATKKSEDVTVSTAKTDKEVKKTVRVRKENTFEIVDSSGQIKKEPMVEHIKEEEEDKELDISLHDREMHRKLWEEKFHKRPGITEDKMKVDVQQFSAIEKHQNMIEVKLPQCRSTIGWEKLLEGTGGEAFLDILKQQSKRVKETIPMLKKVKKEENRKSVEVKEEPVDLYPPE